MSDLRDLSSWGYLPLFALLFWATWLTRGAFLLWGERVQLPPGLQKWLRYAPAAALGALVAPELLLVGGHVAFKPELIAAGAVLVVAALWRNPWAPFAIGMGVVVALKALFGG